MSESRIVHRINGKGPPKQEQSLMRDAGVQEPYCHPTAVYALSPNNVKTSDESSQSGSEGGKPTKETTSRITGQQENGSKTMTMG